MTKTTRAIAIGVAALLLLVWLLRSGGAGEDRPRGEATDPAGPRGGAPLDLSLKPDRPAFDLRRAERAAIAGHVLDPRGRAIAGATVCAGARAPGLSVVERNDRRCATSEADGAYRIDDLLPVPHFVHASAPRFIPEAYRRGTGATASGDVLLRAGQEARDIDITLQPGGALVTGIVRDLSGGELEGALVSSRYAYARSNAEGRFELWVRPGQVHVRASAEGYVDGDANGIAPGQVLEIYLTPESVLVGRVVRAEDGAPVVGAEVRAQEGGGWRDHGPAITDAAGNFRLEGLAPGAYKAEASHEEAFGMAEEQAVLGLGETSAPVEIRAHPAFMVEGRVVITDGGSCERGYVTLTDEPRATRRAAIEPDGSVRARGLLAGTYQVAVDCDNYVPKERYEPIVVDKSVRDVRWEVSPGQAIRGLVVTARGAPVPDVSINAEPIPDPNAPRAQSTGGWSSADGQGRFDMMGLLPGRYRLGTWSDEHPRPDPVEVELRPGHDLEDIRITLPAVGEIRGSVKDSQGRPVKGADISLRGDKWGLPSTRAADDGSFRLANVPPGTYRATAGKGWTEMRAPGTGDDDLQGTPVTVAADTVTTVDLVVEAQSATIHGRVVDADGGPLVDAFIEATRESDSATASAGSALRDSRWSMFFSDAPKLTDQDGRFELTGLAEGKYTLVARRRGGGEGSVEHVATGSDVEIRMSDAGSLAGVVQLAGGGSPAQFTVRLEDRQSGYRASDEFFRTGGTFRFPEVPKGKYEVTVEAPEGASKAEASVSEGGRGEVRVELVPRITVRGRVVDVETGAPVPGMEVKFSAGNSITFFSNNSSPGTEVTDAEGRFEVEKVAAGEAQVSILPKNFGDNGYGWSWLHTRIQASGAAVVELPPFKVAKSRTDPGESAGDLGYKLMESDPETKPEERRLRVGFVRPGGPAAQAGLQVGDEITSIDGHDVTGTNIYLYREMTSVRAGTKVSHGLARGASLEITAGKAH